jgi:enoyl-CoA hydratase
MAVGYERIGPVAIITVDRPERKNAIDWATAELLGRAWRQFDLDEEAVVGILTGEGGTFCAGADLKSFDLVERPEGWLGFTRLHSAKPTLAAVEGHCVAGGLEMALWCDMRIAAETAVFGFLERRFGVPLLDGGTQRLPRIVGLSRALDLILTGRQVDAAEAHRMGLVDRVVPEAGARDAALEVATEIARFPQQTLRSDRAAVYEGLGRSLEEGLAVEARLGRAALDEAAEGAARFADGAGRSGAALD